MRKLLLPTIIVSLIWADGGIIPPQNHEIYGEDQVALIKILPDSEELSILVKLGYTVYYNGAAWVVPLPSLPEVSEVDESLFVNLSTLSASYRNYGGCGGPGYYEGYGLGGDYFKVIEYNTIGFLQTVLIQTNDPDTLTNWLINNGYQLPDGATEMFGDYINRQWQYFFIARVDTSLYDYENNIGICFKFATDTIVYPMKISSLTSTDGISLYLYVIGEHKMFFDDAELLYANRISKEELEAIEEDFPTLFNYIKEDDYITKLRRTYEHPNQISSDITIYQSPDDIEYRKEEEPDYWYLGFANSMLLPMIILLLYTGFARIKRKLN